MIGSVRGTLLDRMPARTGPGAEVLVEVGGVGYRLTVLPGTMGILGELGTQVFLHVHTHVREDAIVLYGFASREERVCFEALLGAHNVGPGTALAILTVHAPAALRRAVLTDDAEALCLVPGIGRKTAPKLLLELKSRLDVPDLADDAHTTGPTGVAVPPGASVHAEVRAALAGLGYDAAEIREIARTLPEEGSAQDLLRLALRGLAVR